MEHIWIIVDGWKVAHFNYLDAPVAKYELHRRFLGTAVRFNGAEYDMLRARGQISNAVHEKCLEIHEDFISVPFTHEVYIWKDGRPGSPDSGEYDPEAQRKSQELFEKSIAEMDKTLEHLLDDALTEPETVVDPAQQVYYELMW